MLCIFLHWELSFPPRNAWICSTGPWHTRVSHVYLGTFEAAEVEIEVAASFTDHVLPTGCSVGSRLSQRNGMPTLLQSTNGLQWYQLLIQDIPCWDRFNTSFLMLQLIVKLPYDFDEKIELSSLIAKRVSCVVGGRVLEAGWKFHPPLPCLIKMCVQLLHTT